jgi:uncharacterized protein (DUF305 family)
LLDASRSGRSDVRGAASATALVAFFLLIRCQTAISDREFLRSMIPHHGAAILMCERAPIEDAEVVALCRNIVSSQQAEIERMRQRLRTLGEVAEPPPRRALGHELE